MRNTKEQIELLKEIRVKRSELRWIEDFSRHKKYILSFLNKHRVLFYSTLILLVTQGVIENFLVFVSRNKLTFRDYNSISQSFILLFTALLITFLVNSFFSIKQEKTIVVLFINSLRRRIFKNYLNKQSDSMNSERQADLISKISYHLPLVSLGVSNSFFGIIRWVVYLASALVVAILAGLNTLLIFLVLLSSSFIIAVTAYFVVKRYVSQEVTFYSQIIKHVDLSLSEKYFYKNLNLEPATLKKFDTLVKFDSIFRVRRDIWMRMSSRVVFIILIVVSVLTNIFYNDIVSEINLISPELKFLYVFLLIYLSRIINESLKVGLYFFHARLGLTLSNIKLGKDSQRVNMMKINKSLTFYSRKLKFFKEGKYYRNLDFNFFKGGRYLFHGPNLSGKTSLARLFFGNEVFNPKAVKVRIDGERFHFNTYQRKFNDVYFFDPRFNSQKSLIEVITGLDRGETDFSEIERALKIIGGYPDLARLVSADNNYSSSAGNIWGNHLAAFSLHSLHCLVRKPTLVIIDNLWLDLNYQGIDQMLKDLSAGLPESIIIVFSNKKINNLNYDQFYDFRHNLASRD